ncbi:hypothetical protein Tco_0791611 [Tanacetum coccineum]
MSLTLVIDAESVNVISTYTSQMGLSEEEKKTLLDSLDEIVKECPTNQRQIIRGDLNGHIGVTTEKYSGFIEVSVMRCGTPLHVSSKIREALGVAIGKSKTHTVHRESWWLSEEVQSYVTVKQARFRKLLLCREGDQEDRIRAHERYKEAKRESKKPLPRKKKRHTKTCTRSWTLRREQTISAGLRKPEREEKGIWET